MFESCTEHCVLRTQFSLRKRSFATSAGRLQCWSFFLQVCLAASLFFQANRQRWTCWESDTAGVEVEAKQSLHSVC